MSEGETAEPVRASPVKSKASFKASSSVTPVQQRFSNFSVTSPIKRPTNFLPSSPTKVKEFSAQTYV